MNEDIKRQVEERVREERKAAKPEDSKEKNISINHIVECAQDGQVGAALLLCELHPEEIVFIKKENRFVLFYEGYWQFDDLDYIHSYIFDVVAAFGQAYEKFSTDIVAATESKNNDQANFLQTKSKILLKAIKNLQNRRYMKSVISYVGDFTAKRREIFDKNPYYIRCEKDLVDLKTGFSRPCKPSDYLLTGCPTKYRQDAEEPRRWKKFLLEISYNQKEKTEDPEWVNGLQIVLGFALIGKVIEEKIIICFGPKASNGKSVLFDVLEAVLGDLVVTFNIEMLLHNKFGSTTGPTPDIIDLNGARLALGNEAPKGVKFEESVVKKLASPGTLKSRGVYARENTTFKPTHTPCMAVNEIPGSASYDEGFHRRIIVVPFLRKFVDYEPKEPYELPRDKDLTETLITEAEQILCWLVQGCLLYQRDGLKQPACFLEEAKKYRRSVDLLADFLDEYCILHDSLNETSAALFEKFEPWYSKEINKKGCSQRFFGLLMGKKFEKGRDKVTGLTTYTGLSLN